MKSKLMIKVCKKLGILPDGRFEPLTKLPDEVFKASYDVIYAIEDTLEDVIHLTSSMFQGNVDYKWFTYLKASHAISLKLRCQAYKYLPKSEASSEAIPLKAYKGADILVRKLVNGGLDIPLVILLHGAPGTGKSNFFKVCGSAPLTRLTSSSFEEKELDPELFTLIDEVDFLYDSYKEALHNFLDDVRRGEYGKVIVVMTTNNFDKIKDTPLVRPGRVDKIIEVGLPCEEDLEVFFSLTPEGVTREAVMALAGERPTIAKLSQCVKDIYLKNLVNEIE